MKTYVDRQRQRVNEVVRWAAAGLGGVCIAGLLGLLQAPELSTALRVACFGFVTGLVGAVALLVLWEATETGRPGVGSRGAVELLVAVVGTVTGLGAVIAHLDVAAAVAGLCLLLALFALDGILLLRRR